MQLSGTKQDWSKIYALIQLLLKGTIENTEIQKIIRKDESGEIVYHISSDIIHIKQGEEYVQISRQACKDFSSFLFSAIHKSKEKEFIIPEAETMLHTLRYNQFYSISSDKRDFTISLSDSTHIPIMVKSRIPYYKLLPANRAANIKYDILNIKFSNPEANKINRIDNWDARLYEIKRLGGKLKYTTTENKISLYNLSIIDLHLPKLLSEITRLSYITKTCSIKKLVEEIKHINPYKIKEELIFQYQFYEYKTIQFLLSLIAGMRPSKIYKGYGNSLSQLFIQPDGSIAFLHNSDKKYLGNFLFDNAYLSIPDCESYRFGFIEKENNQWYIKLNLEIFI